MSCPPIMLHCAEMHSGIICTVITHPIHHVSQCMHFNFRIVRRPTTLVMLECNMVSLLILLLVCIVAYIALWFVLHCGNVACNELWGGIHNTYVQNTYVHNTYGLKIPTCVFQNTYRPYHNTYKLFQNTYQHFQGLSKYLRQGLR